MKGYCKKDNTHFLNKSDYIIFFLLSLCTFLLFSQEDVIITGNHGLLMLEGSIFDFYSRCYELMGEYSANYLPSTFIVYAIWNIPIKLMGAVAHTVKTTPLWQIYWYKFLPCIIYMICVGQICKLCRQLKFDDDKARFIAYAFMTAPLAFFGQFIFFQYDIFTVFFMLLALRFYFSDNLTHGKKVAFCLCFGMAFTFKYHVVLFFLVLLFLKIKEVPKLIAYSALAALPATLEILFYFIFDREAFSSAVMGFSALNYVSETGIKVGFSSVNLMILCACILLAWSYFTISHTQDVYVCDAFFFCSGMCVVLFGLMAWHPQWLLLGVLFWTISTCLNKYCDTFLWLDMLEIAVFYFLTVIKFAGNVDQSMLSYGIFHKLLYQKELDNAISMRDVYRIADFDDSILYSVFLAILVIQFIFKHRRYCQDNIRRLEGSIWLLRLRMWCGVLLFVVPALLCLPDMLLQKTILEDYHVDLAVAYVLDLEHREVIQEIPKENVFLSKVQLFTGTFGRELAATTLLFQVREVETDAVIAEAMVSNAQIKENAYTDFEFEEIELKDFCTYQFVINVITSGNDENVTLYYYEEADWTTQKNLVNAEGFQLYIGEEQMESSLVMRILGTPGNKTK